MTQSHLPREGRGVSEVFSRYLRSSVSMTPALCKEVQVFLCCGTVKSEMCNVTIRVRNYKNEVPID